MRVAHRRNKIVVLLNDFRLVLFSWTLGARDVIQEKQLDEIIEWEHKYVYLFNALSYANRESVSCLMALRIIRVSHNPVLWETS